jgi:hypothetical protein
MLNGHKVMTPQKETTIVNSLNNWIKPSNLITLAGMLVLLTGNFVMIKASVDQLRVALDHEKEVRILMDNSLSSQIDILAGNQDKTTVILEDVSKRLTRIREDQIVVQTTLEDHIRRDDPLPPAGK